ncbi:MAG: hypothetical protein MI743_20815 [Sneathiellales bacterium]|nr:hypothetical protein [Sneathiellales bacterium]
MRDRIPVLACGSNAAPDQLIRKYPETQKEEVPVTRARLHDFICVYSAHIAAYGAIPATLFWQPDTVTDCHITWLSENQLYHMHQTEAIGVNYRFSKLTDIIIECEKNGPMTDVFAYISNFGSLQLDQQPVPITQLAPKRFIHPPMSQLEIQEKLVSEFFKEVSSSHFIMENIDHPELRKRRIRKLAQHASPFSYPAEEILLNSPL